MWIINGHEKMEWVFFVVQMKLSYLSIFHNRALSLSKESVLFLVLQVFSRFGKFTMSSIAE